MAILRVILRTHGGLGNQLFQIAFGRLMARTYGAELVEIHEMRYPTRPTRSTDVAVSVGVPSAAERLTSYLRLPKLTYKAKLSRKEYVHLGGTFFCDGYFQSKSQYDRFAKHDVAQVLRELRESVGIAAQPPLSYLIHLRLGDFFKLRSDAQNHARERLTKVPLGADVITNEEAVFAEPDIAQLVAEKQLRIVSTENFSGEDVLRFMAQYQTIDANDSTLVFWASVLSGSAVAFRSPALQECRDYFRACLESAK